MLDEPTAGSNTDASNTDGSNTEQDKPVRRRRATTKASGPAADSPPAAPTSTAPPSAAEALAVTADAVTGEAPAAPAKRARKAPAKKAAPRKRTAKAAAPDADQPDSATPTDRAPADQAPAEQVPLTEEELATQVALAAAGEPVVTPVEDDPIVQENLADDVTTQAVEAPAKRTRTRRAAVVTFQAPEPVVAPPPADDDGETAAPRRRRRAGTAGAGAPGALELIEPTSAPTTAAKALDSAPDPTPQTADSDADSDDDGEDGDRPRRRRRGRRGRGPRRPDDETGEETTTPDEDAPEGEPSADAEAGDDEEDPSGTRRRRRRRSRSGAGADPESGSEEPLPTTTARTPREPRAPRNRGGSGGSGATTADEDGVRGISGSTRMAAKRVRRQEGRDSGRKRAPILSEAEFLARREAVDRTMVVRQRGDRTQIAVLEDGVLVEHYVTRASAQSYAGNVYLGRVQNVLPSMEAAFVDIGKSRNAVLYAGEVNYDASVGGRSRSIESVLKSGQEVLVQVSKDPIGQKGSRLTGQVSLPGRYLVYVPEGSMTGISRKLPETERSRLKAILKQLVPDEAGVIIRTAAEGASEQEIAADVGRLQAQWQAIQAQAAKGGAPALLHAEPDLVIRVVRDVFNEDFTTLVVQGDSEWETIKEYVDFVAPDLAPRLSRHTSERDVFAEHRVDEQLLKALDRKVYLPSGGSLVIDRTEAMVVVDVNTGKYVGKGGNLEETVTRNNLEAAEEIARQLRLRDLGGIIVVDFIDMVLESNRDLVVRRLVECLGRDRTKHQVAEVTSLGLVQMTRKRVGQGLLESFSEPCESCNGRGVHVHSEPVDERQGGGGGAGGGGGGGDEPRRERSPRVRSAKPLPADAPKPGAAIGSASAIAAAAGVPAASGTAVPSAFPATSDDSTTAAGSDETDTPPTPKRRRRGGRGTGAATMPAGEELAELLSPTADAEAVETAAAETAAVQAALEEDVIVETAAVQSPVGLPEAPAEPLPEPSDEPPVEAIEPGFLRDRRPPAPWSAFSADRPLGGILAPAADPEPHDAAATPRRRRRATSRPAGPPA